MSFVDKAFSSFSDLVDENLPLIASAGAAYMTGGASLGFEGASAAALKEYAPLISAGATLAGSMMNNNTSRSLAGQQQAFSASQAGSIYQRGAADLAAAGINPILAYGSPASMASYTQPNIQPSLALAANSYVSALDTYSSVGLKNAQTGLTGAKTANEPIHGALMHAQTEGTNASTAARKIDTIHEMEKIGKTQLEKRLIEKDISLRDVDKVVKEAQAFLSTSSAQNQLSAATLNAARTNVLQIEAILKSPKLQSILENPALHKTGENAKAFGEIASPLYDLVKALSPVKSRR